MTNAAAEIGGVYSPKDREFYGELAVVSGIDRSVLFKATEGYQDFVLGVSEGIWNEIDAGATWVHAQLVHLKSRVDLKIYGNGYGISNAGLLSIVRLMDSPSSRDPKKRGRVGSGSKAFCQHALALTVETVRADEPGVLYTITYTTQELVELLSGGHSVNWRKSEIPANHEIRGHGTCFTWHAVGGRGISRQRRTADRIVDELHRYLSSDNCRKVTVINARKNRLKVKQRELIGQKIEGSDTIKGIGAVTFEIAVTEELQELESLRVWAHDPVSGMLEFLERVKPTPGNKALMIGIRQVLCHPQVIGSIAVPSWGEYVIRGHGAGFMQHFYEDDEIIFEFLKWLNDVLVPKVQAVIGVNNTQPQSDDDTIIDELVRGWQQAGSVPTDTTPRLRLSHKQLETTPTQITGEPGDRIEIEIDNPDDGTTYKWDASRSGSTISVQRGKQTTITLGSTPGQYLLLVRSGSRTREIRVEIVARLTPRFSRNLRRGEPGQRKTHRILFPKHIVGKPVWDFSNAGGSHKVASDGLSATHVFDTRIDTYTVKASAKLDDGTTWRKVVTVQVEPPAPKPLNRPERPSERSFVFNGRTYELHIVRLMGPAAHSDAYFIRPGMDKVCVVQLNFGHPTFSGSDAMRMHVADLMLSHCIATNEIMNDRDLLEENAPRGAVRPEERALKAMLRRSATIFAERSKAQAS